MHIPQALSLDQNNVTLCSTLTIFFANHSVVFLCLQVPRTSRLVCRQLPCRSCIQYLMFIVLCLQSTATIAATIACDLLWLHLLLLAAQDNRSINITVTHGIAHMGVAKQWNSIKNNSSECCSDVGMNQTCHHCEHGISKMNGLCLLTRLKQQTQVVVKHFWPRFSLDVWGTDSCKSRDAPFDKAHRGR